MNSKAANCLRKRGYWIRADALQAIDMAKFSASPVKPIRAYKCDRCPRWHLSSRPLIDPAARNTHWDQKKSPSLQTPAQSASESGVPVRVTAEGDSL